jgi:hypothetical protein
MRAPSPSVAQLKPDHYQKEGCGMAAVVAAHFASRRLDARLGNADGFFARFRLRRRTSPL